MAMYPDEQEKLYRSIRSVIPQGHSPVGQMTSLARTQPQCFPDIHRHIQACSITVMGLRDLASLSNSRPFSRFSVYCMRSPYHRQVNSFNKEATEDCVLPTSDGRGIVVPKGTQVAPIVSAMHYNRT